MDWVIILPIIGKLEDQIKKNQNFPPKAMTYLAEVGQKDIGIAWK